MLPSLWTILYTKESICLNVWMADYFGIKRFHFAPQICCSSPYATHKYVRRKPKEFVGEITVPVVNNRHRLLGEHRLDQIIHTIRMIFHRLIDYVYMIGIMIFIRKLIHHEHTNYNGNSLITLNTAA